MRPKRRFFRAIGDFLMGRPPPGYGLKEKIVLPSPLPRRSAEEVKASGAEAKAEAKAKRLRSEDERCWYSRTEMVCAYCQVKGQMEAYKLPVSEEAELEKRRRKGNYPNLRCKNCDAEWRDQALK